ncbi:hypothetical protein FJTKL_10478 [Diaporthe vaccinii]|uniref:FHA domain-containing protein n=1 Tax=Diaporthe vaccinii TaxID=105482 RepID=A0ABR4EJL1_9PEZI
MGLPSNSPSYSSFVMGSSCSVPPEPARLPRQGTRDTHALCSGPTGIEGQIMTDNDGTLVMNGQRLPDTPRSKRWDISGTDQAGIRVHRTRFFLLHFAGAAGAAGFRQSPQRRRVQEGGSGPTEGRGPPLVANSGQCLLFQAEEGLRCNISLALFKREKRRVYHDYHI